MQSAVTEDMYRQGMEMVAATDNVGSARDSAQLLAQFASGRLLNPRWTDYCMGVLHRQKTGRTRIPGLLPKGTRT